jgi:MipA family protein
MGVFTQIILVIIATLINQNRSYLMHTRISIYLLVTLGIVFGSGTLALAEDDSLAVGLILGTGSSIYKGADTEVDVLPMISYRKGGFFIDGTVVGYSLLQDETFQLDVFGEYGGDGYKASDSDYLVGMERRKSTIDAGVSGTYFSDFGMFSLDLATDVSSTHDGQEVTFSYGIPLYESDDMSIMSSVGAIWKSGKKVNYYYGVSADEARSGRSAYKANSAINGFVGVDFSYHPWEYWELMVSMQGEYLGEEIRNSPLIDKDYQASVMVGLVYHFW